MSFSEIETQVEDALKLCREPYGLVQLARSPLADSALVSSCYLPDEQPNSTIRGLTVRALLTWAIERLRPGGEIDWGDYRWRLYLVLHFPYIEASKSFRELANLMMVGEKAVYDSRQKALSTVATILHDEMASPHDLEGRQRFAVLARYEHLAPNEQLLLRILSIFRYPVPVIFVHQLSAEAQLPDGAGLLRNLVNAGLIESNTRRAEVEVRQMLREPLRLLIAPLEMQRWRQVAADHYRVQQEFLESAEQLRLGMDLESAASLVVEHYQAIVDSLQIDELRGFLGEFRPNQLQSTTWLQLKLITGQLATMSQDIDTAIAEFRQATQASDVLLKAQAYHHLAHVCKQRNVQESLSYYGRCIDLLRFADPQHQLLARAITDRAWLQLEHQHDMAKVTADLDAAKAIIDQQAPVEWLDIRSDWHNTRGEQLYHQQAFADALQARWEAWLAANEANDLNRKVNTLHNLGSAYMDMQEYEQAITYLSQCEALSRDVGHQRILGLCHKTIGACHYYLDDRLTAVQHYQLAYQVFAEMNQTHWLAGACIDLTEAYAELGEMEAARRYHDEGKALARSVGATAFVDYFEKLEGTHNQFGTQKLSKQARRQQLALEHVAEYGSISNQAYQPLAGVKYRTALKDLNALVAQGKLQRVGEGRGTRYVMDSAEKINLSRG